MGSSLSRVVRFGIAPAILGLLIVGIFSIGANVVSASPIKLIDETHSSGIGSFGTGSNSNDVPNWDEEGPDSLSATRAQEPSVSGEDTVSPNGGRFAKIAFEEADDEGDGNNDNHVDEWICREVDASGYSNLKLSYYWRGDANSNSESDDGIVEYHEGSGGCDVSGGWEELQNHDMRNDVSWSTQPSFDLPDELDNTTFRLRFRNSANHNDEFFRVDGVLLTGETITPTATLTLVKTITNDDTGTAAATDWTLSASSTDTVTVISGVTGAGSITAATVSAGTYVLSETDGPSGYTAGAWQCTAGTLDGSTLTLAAGQTATCTINNDDVPPTLTNETIVVHSWDLDTTSSNPLDVIMYNDTNDTIDNTLGAFVAGPAVAPAGAGSVQFTLGASPLDRKNIATYQFSGTVLTTITEMSYSAYSHSGVAGPTESPYFNFNVDFTGSSGAWQKRLVYVPSANGAVPQDAWNTFDVIDGGDALWTWSGYASNGNKWPDNNTSQYRTWDEIKTAFPGARVLPVGGWLGVRVGEPGPTSYVGNVDKFVISIQSGTTIHTTTYDFEPDTTAPEMPVHVWPENGAVMPASYLTHLDWTDVTDDSMPVTYYYQSSHSSATTTGTYGSDFTTPIYQSGALSASQIAALGTPEGTYFWHVRAVDGAGNSTPWTAPWNVIVDNTPPDVTVTIVKYINGEHATADNTDGASFPMHAIFPGGEGNYSLGTTGFNNPNAYEATTSNMPWGSDYSTYEITSVSGPVYPTGAECPVGSFRLAGYRVGNTLEDAETAALSTTTPAFDGLMTSKYVIVENEPCLPDESQIIQPTDGEETSGSTELEAYYLDENADGNDGVQWAVRAGTCAAGTNTVFGNVDGKNTPFTWNGMNFYATIDTTQVADGSYCFVFNPTEDGGNANQRLTRAFTINNPDPVPTVTMHIYKYLSDGEAEALIPNDTIITYHFPMSASWSAVNIGSGSGSYTLGNDHGHPSEGFNYTASTSVMSAPADYATHEVTTSENESSLVLPSDALCQPGMYKLLGYRTGETLAAAEVATLSTTTPSFTGITSDRHIIVVNKKCGNVPEVQTSTVTMCKFDQNENGLSGWRLTLKGETVNDFTLMANSILGANTDSLIALNSYLATISGTWTNVGHNDADAEYTSTSTPVWTEHMQGYPGLGEDEMDVQVGGQFIDWGTYNSGHSYTYAFTPTSTGPVNFRVFDGTAGVANAGWYGDNDGALALNVARGYTGVTSGDGCITFENVPYGSYTISEENQPGWTNETGLGAVIVDAPTETFNVVNSEDVIIPPPTSATLTIVKHTIGDDGSFEFTVSDGEWSSEENIETSGGYGTTTVELEVGYYDVTENVPEGWQLTDVSCDYDGESEGETITNGESIEVGSGDNVTCTFTNTKEESETPQSQTPNGGGGGGNGPIAGSFGVVTGGGLVLGASTSTVPGNAAMCSDVLLTQYMRRGRANNPEQVRLLQTFLNGELNSNLPVTGFFGLLTENAVKAFQTKHAADILTPWGLTEPTGFVYKTTLRRINLIHCTSLSIPMPDLTPFQGE